MFKTGLRISMTFVLFILGIHGSLAQEVCTSPSQKDISNTPGGYRYEVYDQDSNGNFVGTGCITPSSASAAFSGRWNLQGSNGGDFLARRDVYYGSGKTYKQVGGLQLQYTADWEPQFVSGGNSNIGVYGWFHANGKGTTAEFYIVEDWYQWNHSMDTTAQDLGQVNVNGVEYEVYKTTRSNQPTPWGSMTFPQYVSVRKDRGSQNQDSTVPGTISGTINITQHFAVWEKLGLDLSAELAEVSFSAEGYQSNGSVNVSQLGLNSITSASSIAFDASTYNLTVADDQGNGIWIFNWTTSPANYDDNADVVIFATNTNTNAYCNNVTLWRYQGMWFMSGMNPGSCDLTIYSMDGLASGKATVTVTAGTAQYRVVQTRALGSVGGEQLYLLRDGHRVAAHKLTSSFQTFTDKVYGDGDVSVEFTTDDGKTNGHDVRLDYISVDGIVRQTESMASNTAFFANGRCGGGGYSEWMNCNGAVDFGALNNNHVITIRARGNAGGEHIVLLVNGQPVNNGWYLSTSFQTYSVTVAGDGDLNVRFDNDGGLRDAVIDWLEVDSQIPRQAENMQYNTGYFANGRCGGGSYSEWMQCNGVIGFGRISDNFH